MLPRGRRSGCAGASSRYAGRMAMWTIAFRRRVALVGIGLIGALLWQGTQRAAAQVRPDAPGSTPVVRLDAPRIPPLPETEWTAEQRALVERYASEVRIGNAFRTMLRVPELVEAVMPFVLFTSIDSTLSARHRALLILRTAWLTRSSYLWADHVPTARAAGVMPDEIRRVAEGPGAAGWDPFEATLLRLADELYVNSSVRDATWDALAARYDLYNLFDAVMA
ncbi:MAG: carboxymuconolactone decarboxylase family protein, partial [Acidobacteria bacterium]|nr:carboxymuconolactone decarboxylase family protein [Acidobacteriota bacterium]